MDEGELDSEEDRDISTSFFMDESSDGDQQATRVTPATRPAISNVLYKGAPEGLTDYVANLLLFQFSVRHSLTAKALEELLMLLSAMLPADAKLPKTVHQLKKIFLGKDVI